MSQEPPQPAEDLELIQAVLQGDRERFGELVERYQGRLVNHLFRMLRSVEEARDLAQEVFFKVYQALDRYDPRYRFSTWLFRVAQNAAIDRIRKRRLQTVSMDRQPDPEGGSRSWEFSADGPDPYRELRSHELSLAIQRAIEGLPWEYRELIVLRHYGELSYGEIAELKEMPLGTVKNKLFRARQMMKEKLGDFLAE